MGNKGLQRGLQTVTRGRGGCNSFQGFRRRYRDLQGVTGVTRRYRGLQAVTGD